MPRGATLETIVGNNATEGIVKEGDTGLFFEEQNIKSLLNAIDVFERNISKFNKDIVRANALRFSKERFEKEFEDKVNLIYKEWKKQ